MGRNRGDAEEEGGRAEGCNGRRGGRGRRVTGGHTIVPAAVALCLARNLSKRSQTLVTSRFLSKGAIPTSSAVEVDGTKVLGLPHLTTSNMRWAERQKNWLSDPATYPLVGILGAACCFCTGFGIYFLTVAPDVQISPLKRNKTMRDWK